MNKYIKKYSEREISNEGEKMNKYIKKYSEREISNIESNKIKIVKTYNDINDFVNESINSGSSNKTLYFGKISDSLAEEIYTKLGINLKNYNISLKASNVKKIMKDHGNVNN